MDVRLVVILAAIAGRGASALQHVVTEFSFTQPQGISSWDTWNFFSAGSFFVPERWSETSIRWSFDGAVDAWYYGQASVGTASCYSSVPPVAGAMTASGACAIQPSKTPYAVGVWLWGTAAVLGGTWTITVEYAPNIVPPPMPPKPGPPSPARHFVPPSPPPYSIPPAPAFGREWAADESSGCVSTPFSLVCDAGVDPMTPVLPGQQLASLGIPYSDPGDFYMGIFLTQMQEFSNLGFPAPVVVTDATQTYNIWSADLPTTPRGESCQAAGDDCPNGTLAGVYRPTAFAPLLAAGDGLASTILIGYAPSLFNTWGTVGGAGCEDAGTCANFGPVVRLTVVGTQLLIVQRNDTSASARGDVLMPTQWLGAWSNYTLAFASGEGRATALMTTSCASANVTAQLGWTAGGLATLQGVLTGTRGLNVTYASGSKLYPPVAFGGSTHVASGPLSVTIQLDAPCGATDWIRVMATDLYVTLEYPPPPVSGFVVKQNIGSCLRGMQPLYASPVV